MKVKLSDVCSSIYDGDHSAPPKSSSGIPFVTISNFDPSDGEIDFTNTAYVPVEYYESLKLERRPMKNDVLYSVVGSFGIPSLVKSESEFVFQRHIAILRPNELIDPRYLYYVMKNRDFYHWADSVAIGAAQRTVTLGQLRSKEIELPEIEAQRRIAGVLSAYDELIENNRRQIKLLEEAAQRLYKEWFIDLNYPGHESTPIHNGLPEGWRVMRVSELCETVGGGTPSTKEASYYEGGTIPWVTPTDVTHNNCLALLQPSKYITQEGLSHSSAKLLPARSILMTSRATVGYFAICNQEVCTNQGFISCIPSDDRHRWFLLLALMSKADGIRSLASGSTFKEISKSNFRTIGLLFPSEQVLNRFDRAIEPIYEQLYALQQQISAAREARDRLLPKLMSGEIEV